MPQAVPLAQLVHLRQVNSDREVLANACWALGSANDNKVVRRVLDNLTNILTNVKKRRKVDKAAQRHWAHRQETETKSSALGQHFSQANCRPDSLAIQIIELGATCQPQRVTLRSLRESEVVQDDGQDIVIGMDGHWVEVTHYKLAHDKDLLVPDFLFLGSLFCSM